MSDFKIAIRHRMENKITKEILSTLVNQRLTIRNIATTLGCSYTNVRYWLKVYGLKTFPSPNCRIPGESHLCRCGESDSSKFYGRMRTICSKCHNRKIVESGQRKRDLLLSTLGGECIVCGFSKYKCSLQAHHIDPKEKDASYEFYRTWPDSRIIEEAKKCVLLCANCHAAVHAGLIAPIAQLARAA